MDNSSDSAYPVPSLSPTSASQPPPLPLDNQQKSTRLHFQAGDDALICVKLWQLSNPIFVDHPQIFSVYRASESLHNLKIFTAK